MKEQTPSHGKNLKRQTGFYNPLLVTFHRELLLKNSAELDDVFADHIDASGLTYEDKSAIADAYLLMQKGHEGQIRNHSGKPYEVHPKGSAIVYMFHKSQLGETINPHAVQTLLLHDLVEDTAHTHDHIRESQGNSVADSVLALTKPVDETGKSLGEEASMQKLQTAIDAGNPIVKEVKVYERINNIMDRPSVTIVYPMSPEYDSSDYKAWRKTVRKTKNHMLKNILPKNAENKILREITLDAIKASKEDIRSQTKQAK